MADLMRRNTIKASDLEWASPVAIWWRPVGGIDGPVIVMWGRLKPRKSIAGLKTFTVAEWTHHGAKGWWPSDFPPPADGLPAPGAPPTSEK